MPWVKLESTFHEHAKFHRLQRELGAPEKWGLGYAHGSVAMLWSWAISYAPDGVLTDVPIRRIESIVEWRGKRGKWVKSAITVGLIDVCWLPGERADSLCDPLMTTLAHQFFPNPDQILTRSDPNPDQIRIKFDLKLHGWNKRAGSYREAIRKSNARKNKEVSQNVPGQSQDTARTKSGQSQDTTGKCPRLDRDRDRDLPTVEENKEKKAAPEPKSAPAAPDAVSIILAKYREYHPRAAKRISPKSKEHKLITDRLAEGYSAEELCAAIDGCHRSPFHCGQNERGAKYQQLTLIFRDSAHVLAFMEVPEDTRNLSQIEIDSIAWLESRKKKHRKPLPDGGERAIAPSKPVLLGPSGPDGRGASDAALFAEQEADFFLDVGDETNH